MWAAEHSEKVDSILKPFPEDETVRGFSLEEGSEEVREPGSVTGVCQE